MLCWVNLNKLEIYGLKENIDINIKSFYGKIISIYVNICL